MFSESIKSICDGFNHSSKDDEAIEFAMSSLTELMKSVSTLNEYIIIKYNQCILYDLGSHTNRNDFLGALSDLNTAVLFKGDAPISEEFVYNIGNLNFKSHNYAMALHFLNMSLEYEKSNPLQKHMVNLRFHKRCLKAFCLEYMATTKEKLPIEYLIGYQIGKETNRQVFIDKTLKLFSEKSSKNAIYQILDEEICQSSQNLLWWVKKNYDNGMIDNDIYQHFLDEIAHILAHCFSEYWKMSTEKQKELKQEYIYMLRIAEILMDSLGVDFITCYATLKIEHNQFYAAISSLNHAKKKLLDKLFIQKDKTNENALFSDYSPEQQSISKQIAQINFYIWYFSVLARTNDGTENKEEFKQYCKFSKDNIAQTYYYILQMKELLIIANMQFRDGLLKEKTVEELSLVYEEFEKIDLHHTIPVVLIDEWNFLIRSYKVFKLMYKIYQNNNELNSFLVFRELQNGHSSEHFYGNHAIRNKPSFLLYYWVDISNGAFLFRGEYSDRPILREILFNLGIKYTDFNPKCAKRKDTPKLDTLKETLSVPKLKDISNVLVFAKNNTISDDFEFIKALIYFDQQNEDVDQHNIYIDCSNLSNQNIVKISSLIEENKSHAIYLFQERTEATMKCVFFAYVEKMLITLQKPLNSYMISPVSNDETYSSQSHKATELISTFSATESINLKWSDADFGACFASSNNLKTCGKILNISYIKEVVPNINLLHYIFFFDTSQNNADKKRTSIYAFDISEATKNNLKTAVSDSIIAYDAQSDLFKAVEKLYYYLKEQQNHKRVGHKSCEKKCITAFSTIDMDKANRNIELNCGKQYEIIRSYLYSYLGMMMERSVYMLMQLTEAGKNKHYLILAFDSKQESIPSNEFKLCRGFCSIERYITDCSKNMNVKSMHMYPETMESLLQRINPHKQGKKFVFISYRSNGGDVHLCTPVFHDVIYLQEKYKSDFDCVIDVRTFGMDFGYEIENYIKHPDCIGAFIYLSHEYMESHHCLKEIKLLNTRKQNNPDFIIVPVLIEILDERQSLTKESFIINFVREEYNKLKYNQEFRSYASSFKEILALDDESDEPRILINIWQNYDEHISRHSNFKNALSKIGIFDEDSEV